MSMFCYQCQEAAKGTGCTVHGVCGKNDEVSNLQDLLIYMLKGISVFSCKLRDIGVKDEKADKFIVEGLFSTITNANFDKDYFLQKIKEAATLRDELKSQLAKRGEFNEADLHDAALWSPKNHQDIFEKSLTVGILSTKDEDKRSLRELIIYGLKGMAAYTEHAQALGYTNDDIFAFMHKALAATLDESLSADELVALTLETGKIGVEAMALLDKANTETYGHPEISAVNIGVRTNPGILVSGHDLKDLEELLIQTEDTGIDVYTHGEMLPANYYPHLKKYKHLVGNYGNAWWQQDKEFESFNGPILMTTNCLTPPRDSYKDRLYTTSIVGFSDVKHIKDREKGHKKDFSEIIEHAKKCPPPTPIESGQLIGGFAHNTVLSLADKVIEAVKSGAIKKFVVMAGCDGRMNSRGYYTEFAKALPKDCVILTAGCAKYRYNKLDLGDIGGIPRVLDAGQCNDSYSLAVIALKLKEAFGLDDINKLPIVFNIAWYEQKAVIVLLALLYLGFKNIHIGPTLPAFLSPNVAKVIVDTFNLGSITNVDNDIENFVQTL